MAMRTKSFESRLERPPGSTAFQVVAVVKVKKLQHKLHTYCCSNGVVAVVVVVVVVVAADVVAVVSGPRLCRTNINIGK